MLETISKYILELTSMYSNYFSARPLLVYWELQPETVILTKLAIAAAPAVNYFS